MVKQLVNSRVLAELMQMDIKPVIEEKADGDFEFVQQVVAASNDQKQEEINNSGFSEEEKITIANDPALANAFNLAPNVTNLEVAGVLNNKQEEKSDAEKRADEVVAANAKEQEEINKNYMDADQSGIVAASSPPINCLPITPAIAVTMMVTKPMIAFFNPPPELSSDITFSYCLLMITGILTILPETSSRFKS